MCVAPQAQCNYLTATSSKFKTRRHGAKPPRSSGTLGTPASEPACAAHMYEPRLVTGSRRSSAAGTAHLQLVPLYGSSTVSITWITAPPALRFLMDTLAAFEFLPLTVMTQGLPLHMTN